MEARNLQTAQAILVRNRLLRQLSPADLRSVLTLLEPVPLRQRQILHHWNTGMRWVYFIEKGLVSVEAKTDRSETFETWTVGSDGMTGIPVVLGGDHVPPHRRVVHVDGSALQMSAQQLRDKMEQLPLFRDILLRYAQFVLLQTSQIGICNAHHSLQQRLSRWLLAAADGLAADRLPLTHQAISKLLGVRRASVTDCLAALERSGAIEHGRGMIHILDGESLQKASCGCHHLLRGHYRRLVMRTSNSV